MPRGLSSQEDHRSAHGSLPKLPKPTMKERILETADRLFYLQGIRAIGVDTIAAEIGISKRTLYNHFPSKDALIAAYLERRFVQPRPSDKSPVEQILATFDSLERRFSAQGFSRLPVRQCGRRARRRRPRREEDRDRLQGKPPALVSRAAGASSASPRRRRWRRSSQLLVDGSIAQDLVRDDPAMARAAKEAAKVLLGNAGVEVGGPDERSEIRDARAGEMIPDCASLHPGYEVNLPGSAEMAGISMNNSISGPARILTNRIGIAEALQCPAYP